MPLDTDRNAGLPSHPTRTLLEAFPNAIRGLIGFVSRQFIPFRNMAGQASLQLRNLLSSIYVKLLSLVGPEGSCSKPRRETAVWALLGFLAFLLMISLAVKFPCPTMRTVFILFSSVSVLSLSLCMWKDFVQGQS